MGLLFERTSASFWERVLRGAARERERTRR
jgi:hypothetical protein